MLTYGLGSENENLPGFVVMLDPKGGPISGAKNWSSGYMPATYQGNVFRTEGAPILDLAPPSDLPEGVQRELIDSIQQANRDHLQGHAGNDDLLSRIASYELAYKMQTTAPESVDLSTEDAKTLEMYGVNNDRTRDFGKRCLMARRLVQRGVRFVQLYSGGAHNDDNWDAHGDLEKNHNYHAMNTDQPIAALLADLKRTGMLDETLVVWGGEFGRQPTAEYAKGSGRDHNAYGFTMWMAGGGIKGGTSFGTTDELGSAAVENPIHVNNLHATILHQMGLDPNHLSYFYGGLNQKLVGVEEVEPISRNHCVNSLSFDRRSRPLPWDNTSVNASPDRSPSRPWAAWLVHACRVALLVGLLLMIPSPTTEPVDSNSPPDLSVISTVLPAVAAVSERADANGFWTVENQSGERIGAVCRTMPAAAEAVGYRGPTEAVVAVDDDLKIIGAGLLGSTDTRDHVEEVRNANEFFDQFVGRAWDAESWGERKIDGVSGATLTSLALVEGMIARMGGKRASLVFPDPMQLAEVKAMFDRAAAQSQVIVGDASIDGAYRISDSGGKQLGFVLRTGPMSDDLAGYQGPTELLIGIEGADSLSADSVVSKVRIRSSFDNEPYVGYVRQEKYSFWPLFEDKSLRELAKYDPVESGVEGVSGATMSSISIAETLPIATTRFINAIETADQRAIDAAWQGSIRRALASIRWSVADTATTGILLFCLVAATRKWFRLRWFRRFWLVAVIIVIGLWAGNLISLSLFAGWSAEGIAWRLAPGLAFVLVVASVLPPLTKGNPYCNHLCPHGAAQQLVRMPKPPKQSEIRVWYRRRWTIPPKLHRLLSFVPGTTLAIAYVTLTLSPAVDLSAWEPFHAYLFRIAPAASIAMAVATIIVSRFVPMAYCRYGCGTGRLLDYVRRTATSHRFRIADGVAIGLLVLAVAIRLKTF